jgi:sulfate adenylyltransferase
MQITAQAVKTRYNACEILHFLPLNPGEPRMHTEFKLTALIEPYGGALVNLVVEPGGCESALERAQGLPRVQISTRAQHDLEMLAVGAFSPLDRFMGRADYERVLTEMRLADGQLFPIPVTLPVAAQSLPKQAEAVTLVDELGTLLAVMDLEEVYRYDRLREARLALGTADPDHPLLAEMAGWGEVCISGRLEVLGLPVHARFGRQCLTPAESRARLAALGWANIVAFQTRNPMHRIHEELTKRAAAEVGGALLLHPVVGLTRPGDVAVETRIKIYRILAEKYYDRGCTLLSLLPLAMRLAGPREALWHALIRRNYGATHLIVGRDHAGPGKDRRGMPFYGPYEAQALLEEYANELGVQPVAYKELVYLADEDRYEEADRVPAGARTCSISGTQVRQDYLAKGVKLPTWFTRPEVAEVLQAGGSHGVVV